MPHIVVFPVFEIHLVELMMNWKCNGEGREKEGLEITSRFLIWANGWMVMQFTEMENPIRVGCCIQFWTHGVSMGIILGNTWRLGVHKRGLHEDYLYLDGNKIMEVAYQSQ